MICNDTDHHHVLQLALLNAMATRVRVFDVTATSEHLRDK